MDIKVEDAWKNQWQSITSLDKLYRQYGIRNIEWTLRNLCDNERIGSVLDIGCGAGFYFQTFYKMGCRDLVGLEYDQGNLEKAETLNRQYDVKIFHGDIRKLPDPFGEKKFDCIVTMGLIEHFTYPVNIILKMVNMLSEEGFLLLSMPNFRNCLYYMHNIKLKNELPFHLWWGTKEWKKILHNIDGINVEKIQCCNFWSSYHTLFQKILGRIFLPLLDLEIFLENTLFPHYGEAIFVKIRKAKK